MGKGSGGLVSRDVRFAAHRAGISEVLTRAYFFVGSTSISFNAVSPGDVIAGEVRES